jgi:hypothetical protein
MNEKAQEIGVEQDHDLPAVQLEVDLLLEDLGLLETSLIAV